jgi:signal transduction histidine kinase
MSLISRLEQLDCGQRTSAIHRIVSEDGFPLWVSHGFRKVRTDSDESIRGCLLPLPIDACTQNVDCAIISQFVHKIGNHFQLINLLVGALRRSGVGLADVDALQEAVDRTVEFTRAFLDYAQIPSVQSDFELHEVLNAFVEAIQLEFEDKQVSLSSRLHENLSGIRVHGDPLLFRQALGAIFQNALEATRAGDEISLAGKCDGYQSAPTLTAQIVIADTGSGMQIDDLRRSEDPFFSSRRDRDGLGLSMAARIIEQHGGTLRIDSRVGKGTRVVIKLPVSEVRHDPAPYGAASEKSR